MDSYFIHSFRAFLQRPFKSSTTQRRSRLQHGFFIGVSRQSAHATVSKGLAQGPYVAARTLDLRLRAVDLTNAPPCPLIFLYQMEYTNDHSWHRRNCGLTWLYQSLNVWCKNCVSKNLNQKLEQSSCSQRSPTTTLASVRHRQSDTQTSECLSWGAHNSGSQGKDYYWKPFFPRRYRLRTCCMTCRYITVPVALITGRLIKERLMTSHFYTNRITSKCALGTE